MLNSILAEPVYRSSYRYAQNLCSGRIQAAKVNIIKFSELGKDDPAKAKLIQRTALNDGVMDYLADNSNTIFSLLKTAFSVVKNFIIVSSSKDVKKANKEFKESYEALYPNTHKVRDSIIKQNKVVANNNSDALSRRFSFNKIFKQD